MPIQSRIWLTAAALVAGAGVAAAQPAPIELTPGGLTADDAAARAVRVAPEVLHARIAERQAHDETGIGKAAFWPRVDLRASYTRLGEIDQQPITIGGMSFTLSPQILNNYTLHAGVTLPVSDYFLTIAPAYRASKQAAAIATHQLAAQREAAAFTARQYYYGYARAVAAAQIAASAVAQLEGHVGDLDALVTARVATRGDLMQAQAQLADARVQRAAADGAVITLGEQLRAYLGLDRDETLALGEDVLQPLPPGDPTARELEAGALRDRPEPAALRALVGANQLAVEVQQGRRWPSLSLTAGYDYANPNQRAFPQSEEFTGSWSAGAVLSWSPNDAIARKADVGRAALQVSRARTDLVELERRIRTEAAQTATDLRVARAQLAAAEEGVAAGREAWRVQRDLLGAGEATEQQALDAQAALTRAEQSLVDAHLSARIARARAAYVVGRATPK